ncbi:hypothetical protein B9T25_05810 [Acinetobacter sp. ANC 4470]|uniref:DUF3325 domain-containing protein n=1 Tax=Acinetobacter sp. ANC 4470 TaxID=1977881 RepID=UPI000A32ED8D|nr:DUF3325 domain-containing protein [Acinetobacter sp. ANC 4470]OTG68205.1 hypothetical protein B9T25_05810 [Acinetobacter sp. ANC 4470]
MIFFVLIWSICAVAFFALASCMSKHQKQIFGRELTPSKTRLATFTGWILLIIALAICITHGSLSNMISYWIGALTFSALFVGLYLSYFAHKAKPLVISCSVIAILSWITYII